MSISTSIQKQTYQDVLRILDLDGADLEHREPRLHVEDEDLRERKLRRIKTGALDPGTQEHGAPPCSRTNAPSSHRLRPSINSTLPRPHTKIEFYKVTTGW